MKDWNSLTIDHKIRLFSIGEDSRIPEGTTLESLRNEKSSEWKTSKIGTRYKVRRQKVKWV